MTSIASLRHIRLRLSGAIRIVVRQLVTDVSGQPSGPIFKSHTVQGYGTDRSSRKIGKNIVHPRRSRRFREEVKMKSYYFFERE